LIVVSVLVLSLVLAFGAGCGTEPAPEDEGSEQEPPETGTETETETGTEEGGSIVIAMQGNEVPPPDAHDASTISDLCGASMFCEPLIIWKDGEYIGLLAEDWEVSDDGLTEFHNGKVLNAQMIKDNIERIRDPNDPKYASGTLTIISDIEVIDDSTVALHLEKMDPDFLLRLTSTSVCIQEPSSWESGDPAGTGPFQVTEYIPDEKLVVTRFDNYWGEKALLDEIQMRPVPDPSTLVVELETGGAHLILFAPPSEGKRLEELGFNVMPFGRVNWARVAYNMTTVTDKAVREAIAYALDRQAIIDVAYAGYGEIMENLIVPGSWADNDLSGFTYDPEKSKQILDDAGYVDTDENGIREIDGEDIVLHLPTRGDDSAWLRATQMIQKMLFDVGINTEITTAARLSYYEEVRTGNYDITWWLSNAVPEPPVAAGNLEGVSYWNVSQFPKDHPVQLQIDELISNARSILDREERAAYYHELNELWFEEAVEAPGMWLRQIYVADPALKGMYLAPSGVMYQFEQMYLESD